MTVIDKEPILEKLNVLANEWVGTFTVDGIKMAIKLLEDAPTIEHFKEQEYDNTKSVS